MAGRTIVGAEDGRPFQHSAESQVPRFGPRHTARLRVVLADGVLDGSWRQLVAGVVLEGTLTQGRRTGTWTQTDKAGEVRQQSYAAGSSSR